MRLSSFRLFALLSVATLLLACTDTSQEHDTSPYLSMFDADIQLELVQEWELTDTELFPNLTYFQTTGEGKLIAGDFAILRFYKIDSTGNVTRTFSGEGRGTGEMSAFSAMATHPDGRVATADISARRVLIFDTKGDDIITTDHEGGWNTSLQWLEDELVISNNPFMLMATGLPAGSLIMKTFNPESNSSEELFTLELEMQDAPDDQISCTFCPVVFIDEHHFFTVNRDTTYRFHKFDVRTGEAQTFAFSGMPRPWSIQNQSFKAYRNDENEPGSVRDNRCQQRLCQRINLCSDQYLRTQKNVYGSRLMRIRKAQDVLIFFLNQETISAP